MSDVSLPSSVGSTPSSWGTRSDKGSSVREVPSYTSTSNDPTVEFPGSEETSSFPDLQIQGPRPDRRQDRPHWLRPGPRPSLVLIRTGSRDRHLLWRTVDGTGLKGFMSRDKRMEVGGRRCGWKKKGVRVSLAYLGCSWSLPLSHPKTLSPPDSILS